MKSKNIKKIIIIVFALVAIASGFYFAFRKGKGVEAAWYGDSWLYRKKITIDHTKVKAKLNNFPVLASTTDSSLASYAQADGDDILFTSSDGRTKLNHEIEKYDSSTGQLVSWVQAGLSSTTDTVLYMYYGNSSCGEQSTSTLVWDSNYKGVWHLKETDIDGGAGDIKDSTSNANNGSTIGSMVSDDQVGGQIDGSLDFDADGKRVDIGNPVSLQFNGDTTISFWMKTSGFNSTSQTYVVKKDSWALKTGWLFLDDGQYGTQFIFRVCGSANCYDANTTRATVNDGQWHYITGRRSGTTIYLYVDASEKDNTTGTNFDTNTDIDVLFGLDGANAGSVKLDEVHISNSARSVGWIQTEYNNQSSPSTFMTWGDHQSKTALYGAGGLPPILYLKFNEGYGTVAYDSSDYGNDATITGPTWKNEVFCKTGKCLDFDGSNDYLTRAYDTDFNFSTSSFSLSTWFLTNTVSASSTIASRYDSSGWKLWMDSDGDLCFGIDDDATWGGATPDDSACTTNKNYDDNSWHHLTAYRDGTTGIYLYADGQQVASDATLSATNSLSGTAPALYLGVENNGSSSPFTGRLDDFKIYGYARNATQIAADYGTPGTIRGASVSLGSRATTTTSGAPDLTTGLVGYWDFEFATTSDKIVDRSGNESYGILGSSTPLYMPKWTNQGKKGMALDFDGSNDDVNAGNNNILNITDKITIAAWVKQRANFAWASPIYNGGVGFANYQFGIDNGTFGVDWGQDGPPTVWHSQYGPPVTNGRWTYLAWTYDKDAGTHNIKLYKNGLKTHNSTETAPLGGWGSWLYFGSVQHGTNPYNGMIDEVRIYNRALSQREIAWLYNDGRPLAEWHFRGNYNDTGSWCENNEGTSDCKNLTAWGTGNAFASSTLELETSSLRLNGSGDAYAADDVNLDIASSTDFSFTETFMTTDTGNVALLAKRNADSGAGYLLGLDYGLGDGKVFFEVGDGADEFQIQGATNLADGAWHTVTVVFDDDSAAGNKIYVDGRDDTAATSGTLANIDDLSNALTLDIGAESDGGGAIHGKIDRVAFYGYALTSEDAKKEALSTKAVKIGRYATDSQGSDPLSGKPPVSWWRFDERSGTTANNYASSTLNGTWSGTGNHFAPGKVGYAGKFNGSDDEISAGNIGDIKTISYWVKTDSNNFSAIPYNGSTYYKDGVSSSLLGSELITNGNFDSNITGWTNGYGGSIAWQNEVSGDGSTGYLRFNIADNSDWDRFKSDSSVFAANTTYIVSFWYRTSGITGNLQVISADIFSTLPNTSWTVNIIPSTSWKYESMVLQTNSLAYPIFAIIKQGSIGAGNFDIDGISVKALDATISSGWHYITMTSDNNIYASSMFIGRFGDTGYEYLNGLIDDVKAYDYVRTPAQIAWDYNQGKPVGHWKFDEGTGATTQDASENNYDGTITGASWNTSGKIFNALSFNGTSDLVTHGLQLSKAQGTVAMWLKPNQIRRMAAYYESDGTTASTYNGFGDPNNILEITIGITSPEWGICYQDGATECNTLTGGTAVAGQWTHLEITWDRSGNLIMYINGVQAGIEDISGVSFTSKTATVKQFGKVGDGTATRYWDGLIDDVRVYNYVRTPAQVLQDYNNGMSARF